MEIDPALESFLAKWLSVQEGEEVPDGYFRFMRGRTSSQARSCGVDRVDTHPDTQSTISLILETIERLVQDEYRLGHGERQCIFVQYVERGSTRARDWACAFDPGEVSDALSAVGGPLGADLAGRLATGCIAELMRQNRDLHVRSCALLDSQIEMAMNIGQAPSDMSAALESMQPTLAAIGERLPEILSAVAMSRAAKTPPADEDLSGLSPQEKADRHLENIQGEASALAGLIMNDGAVLNAQAKARLRELSTVIETVTRD